MQSSSLASLSKIGPHTHTHSEAESIVMPSIFSAEGASSVIASNISAEAASSVREIVRLNISAETNTFYKSEKLAPAMFEYTKSCFRRLK
jgi:hypothetical protein